jgi:hypothetical protein
MTRALRRARATGAVAVVVVLSLSGVGSLAGAATAEAAPDTVVIPNLGPGYTVSSQGPLDSAQFASNAPDPSAAAGALSTLGTSISTYERVWQADAGRNQVQDLLVRFPDAVRAQVFVRAAQRSLESGEIVSSDAMASIPGARRVTYFAATDQDGVGEAVAMRAGVYVDLLSFFSAASGDAQPISPADAQRVALAQYTAMVQAPGGGPTATAHHTSSKQVSVGTILAAVLVVAVLALAVATPWFLRRRRGADDTAGSSGRSAVDDLRQEGG